MIPPGHEIQAVTFDVGGTLLTPEPSVGGVYARAAARHHNIQIPPELLDSRFREAWRRAQSFQHTRDDWERLVDEVFEGLVPRPPRETFFDELYAEFGRASAWRVFDDVLPTLETLAARGIDLGIISNWDDRLRPLLRELRLNRYFTAVIISCETGFAKPSCVAYEEALRQLGCPAHGVLHIGDSMREDFAGATAAGLHALHLRRDAPPSDLQIQSLQDILPWLTAPTVRFPGRGPANFLTPDG